MHGIPDCLNRRYKALDKLVNELNTACDVNFNVDDSGASSNDPGVRLMCDFWNILKENPDCNLPKAVQQRMNGDNTNASSMFRPQEMSCYMAAHNCMKKDADPKKQDKGCKVVNDCCHKSPETAKTKCCASKSVASSQGSNDVLPLTKVLCNLNEAASFDRKCQGMVNDLMSAQKQLQEQVQHLEHREKEGIQLLKQADCMWSCMEDSYKKKILESQERQQELIKQLKEAEANTNRWRKNKKDLEFQIENVNVCHQEIFEKLNQKQNDLKCMKKDIDDYKKRVENHKKEIEMANKSMGTKKQASDNKIKKISDDITRKDAMIREEKSRKDEKETEGNQYIREARADLLNLSKVLLQKKIEIEDMKTEKEALSDELELLAQTYDQCKDRCQYKKRSIEEENKKIDMEIANFKAKCVRCHQCTDTVDIRKFCTDCPRCLEERECIIKEDHCCPDSAMDCVCMSVKQKFLDNVFENMYTVLERQIKSGPGKTVAETVLNCLKRSRNGKLDAETRQILQDFILTTVKKNLNLTIIGGAVKTRCELDSETYKQLMLCLKQVKAIKPPKADKETAAKKPPCPRWGGESECNCPKGPKACICTKRAPPPPNDPGPCPPQDKEDVGEVKSCPHKETTACGPDCAMHAVPSAVGTDVAAWRPDPCQAPTCTFKNMRAAQCVLGPEALNNITKSKSYVTAVPYVPNITIMEDQESCKCGSSLSRTCACKDARGHPRERIIEEVMGKYFEVSPIEKESSANENNIDDKIFSRENTEEGVTKDTCIEIPLKLFINSIIFPKCDNLNINLYNDTFLVTGPQVITSCNDNVKYNDDDIVQKDTGTKQLKVGKISQQLCNEESCGLIKQIESNIQNSLDKPEKLRKNINFPLKESTKTIKKNVFMSKQTDVDNIIKENLIKEQFEQLLQPGLTEYEKDLFENANQKQIEQNDFDLPLGQSLKQEIEIDEKMVNLIEHILKEGLSSFVSLNETKSGHLTLGFHSGSNNDGGSIIVKKTDSGSLIIEIDENTILKKLKSNKCKNMKSEPKTKINDNDPLENIDLNVAKVRKPQCSSNIKELSNTDLAKALQHKSNESNSFSVRKSKQKQILSDDFLDKMYRKGCEKIEITMKYENKDSSKVKAAILKMSPENVAIYCKNFGFLVKNKIEIPVLLLKSESGTINIDFDEEEATCNGIARKTASNGLLIYRRRSSIQIIKPFNKNMPKSEGVYKIKIKGLENATENLPAVVKETNSGNFDVIIEKEFEKYFTGTLQHQIAEDGESLFDITKTSSSIILNFDNTESAKLDSKKALLFKSSSGLLKIIVSDTKLNAKEETDLRKKSLKSIVSAKALDNLLQQVSSSKSKLYRYNASSINARKTISNSDLYNATKLKLQSNQSLLKKPSTLKKTASGQYAVVLDKESKKSFINNLIFCIDNSSKGVIPIKRTESGQLSIVFNEKVKAGECGSLKITSSGSIFVILDEDTVNRISNNVAINTSTHSKESDISPYISKIEHPENKAIGTNCNACPNDNLCDVSKCVCERTNIMGNASNSFNRRSVSHDVCGKSECSSISAKPSIYSKNKSPHITIKPRECQPVPEKRNRFQENYHCEVHSVCPYHKDRYEAVSNELLEISGFCNDVPKIGIAKKREVKTHSKAIPSNLATVDYQWDSMDYLPHQLPPFLQNINFS